MYKFRGASEGDVYRCILKAVAANPPQLSFSYEDLTQRANIICESDVPVGVECRRNVFTYGEISSREVSK